MGRFAGAWRGMRKHYHTTVYKRGGGQARSHAEWDLKDKETMKCEHGRDVFEVTPTPPTTTTTTTTSAQPLPEPHTDFPHLLPPSIPSGWLHHALLDRGVVESSVAVLANDAPPTHPPTHTPTPSSSQANCCSDSWGPLAAPHWGEKPN